MDNGIIYIVIHKSNGKCYIGKTKNNLFSRYGRKYQHEYLARANSTNTKFHKALREHGPEMFDWFILKNNIPLSVLSDVESELIEEYNSVYQGYNSIH